MPYRKRTDLPQSVRNVLSLHGEKIYKEAFNNAWQQYDQQEERRGGASREKVSHKVAWSAVKKVFRKNRDTGKWVSKKGYNKK